MKFKQKKVELFELFYDLMILSNKLLKCRRMAEAAAEN